MTFEVLLILVPVHSDKYANAEMEDTQWVPHGPILLQVSDRTVNCVRLLLCVAIIVITTRKK